MSAAVDRLEKLGLVVRKSSPSDRRARVVELTAQGKRLATSCFERHANDLEALMSVLSEKEMEQLYGSLKKLGLLAAEKLDQQEAKVKRSRAVKNKLGNDRRVGRDHKSTWGPHQKGYRAPTSQRPRLFVTVAYVRL